jgi:hypothetical protein
MNRYPILLPALIALPVAVVLLCLAVVQELTGAPAALRRLIGIAAAGAMLFGGYGVSRTAADHYEHLCVDHHADSCRSGTVSEFLYRHLP